MTTVIWIDWYSYHISRFRALVSHEALSGQVTGIELVGGCGVHKGMQFRDQKRAGLPIVSLFPTRDWNQVRQSDLARALWQKLNELRPSVVLVPGIYTLPGLAAAVWAKSHGRCSVLMSETTRQDYRRTWWKEIPKRFLLGLLFDYGFAGGKPHARYLRQLGFANDRIAERYDVVDNDFFQRAAASARRNLNLPAALQLPAKYFLFVGRLSSEKNVLGLLKAFSGYCKRGGTWSLVVVGDGPERATLEVEVLALGLQARVHFAGFKATEQVVPYYAFASCFVLPSAREPWGLVVNEAMACGLPVLVSSHCGCAEDLVHHGINGYLFDPVSEGFEARLLSIGALDDSALHAMGEASARIVSDFSPQHWAKEVAEIRSAFLQAPSHQKS
jgi:1,2-diacylglycerol 3-alpha-glucosyltransferase